MHKIDISVASRVDSKGSRDTDNLLERTLILNSAFGTLCISATYADRDSLLIDRTTGGILAPLETFCAV